MRAVEAVAVPIVFHCDQCPATGVARRLPNGQDGAPKRWLTIHGEEDGQRAVVCSGKCVDLQFAAWDAAAAGVPNQRQ